MACMCVCGSIVNKRQRWGEGEAERRGLQMGETATLVGEQEEGRVFPWDGKGEKIRYLAGSTNTALPSGTDV
jgi:hypothetical protein